MIQAKQQRNIFIGETDVNIINSFSSSNDYSIINAE